MMRLGFASRRQDARISRRTCHQTVRKPCYVYGVISCIARRPHAMWCITCAFVLCSRGAVVAIPAEGALLVALK
jgi:hypothetical protein